jgi:dTDP-4-amino-4,6-dideoxygalactose transaminase
MIPMYKPLIEEEEINAAEEALRMGWLGMGSYVAEFEKAVQNHVGAHDRYVAAVSTGHAALHLGLIVAGVGFGDEVITPSFNNIADFQAILAVGAEPVFCDIDDNTLCIDLGKAEELVSPRTKAVIVMDYGCMLCDHQGIEKFARKHDIRVIHDAAHSFGSKYKGRLIGSFSDICMFSFDPVKNITCIDGGALIVQTEEELSMIHEMRLIGMGQPSAVMYKNQRAWTYDVKGIGFRYHMANLHAAIGLAQLNKIAKISENRLHVCRYYSEKLREVSEITIPKTDFSDIIPFLYYIRVSEDKRDSLRGYLRERGIDTGIHWQPGHWFTLFQQYRRGDLTFTDKLGMEILSLPSHPCLSTEELDIICDSIASFFRN